VSRRVSLPGADELFRATSTGSAPAAEAAPSAGAPTPPTVLRPRPARAAAQRPSGRQRHDEKITVYVSPEELVALEHARLNLRAVHGLAVDRGRMVREAVAVVLADLDAKGADSILVRRLRDF
jgi:hypothetical protein